ncbi:MAG: RNA polymerase sigma-70 factor [Bacteroidota bacterium]
MTDALIGKQLRRGNKEALQWLFDEYYTKLVHYALKITADPESSEEMVQDVFVSVWNNRKKLEVNSFYAYLSRAVRNKCITYIQSAMKHQEPIENVMYATKDNDGQQNLEYDELVDALKEAEQLLPEQTRLVFSLSRHSEMTYNEISQELDISVKTVEYHISKAFKLMREFIASRGFQVSLVILMTLL